jgi:hypothetical protein
VAEGIHRERKEVGGHAVDRGDDTGRATQP